MLKVSVIIPNYNHARFLEQRIDSILNQTFQNFEIIFLDDASTDNSKEVFSQYQNHPKISHTIFNEINSSSTFKQWNKGFDLAAGEYVWIAESDDYAAPRFLEELVMVLDRHQDVGIAYSQSSLVDEKSQIISRNFLSYTDCFNSKKWHKNYLNNGRNECENFLAAKNTIPNASAVLIRTAIYKSEVDRANEIFKVAGDWFTWSQILLASDIYFVAESLNYFRFSPGSVSRNTSKLAAIVRESLVIFEKIDDRVNISREAKTIFFNLISSWWLNYLSTEEIIFNREFNSCKKILQYSPAVKSTLLFYWRLFKNLFKRLRYLIKLGTRLQICKNYLKYSYSSLLSLLKF